MTETQADIRRLYQGLDPNNYGVSHHTPASPEESAVKDLYEDAGEAPGAPLPSDEETNQMVSDIAEALGVEVGMLTTHKDPLGRMLTVRLKEDTSVSAMDMFRVGITRVQVRKDFGDHILIDMFERMDEVQGKEKVFTFVI